MFPSPGSLAYACSNCRKAILGMALALKLSNADFRSCERRYLKGPMPTRPAEQPVILVIEDYGDSREMLKLLIAGEGYEVLTAASGEEALELIKVRHIDLILTDLGLPGMDGLTLVRHIRGMSGVRVAVPIIMLTAMDGDENNQAAIKAGCTDFLTKPVDFERLGLMIGKLLQDQKQVSKGRVDGASMRNRKS